MSGLCMVLLPFVSSMGTSCNLKNTFTFAFKGIHFIFSRANYSYQMFIFFSSEQTAALFAAFGSLLSIILVLIFIPHIPKTKSSASKDSNSTTGAGLFDNLSVITKIVFLPNVGFLLFLKLVCGIPIGVLQSMFSSKENTKI